MRSVSRLLVVVVIAMATACTQTTNMSSDESTLFDVIEDSIIKEVFFDTTGGDTAGETDLDDDIGDFAGGLPDGNDTIEPQCTPATVEDDCADVCADLDDCHVCRCNLSINKGTCEVANAETGTECSDDDACTQGDHCEDGACNPGEQICDCGTNEDCLLLEDDDLCNGTLKCDLEHYPYLCKVEESTIVTCPTDQDTSCRTSQCDPLDGQCDLKPANEGGVCDDSNYCTTASECVDGLCSGTQTVVCNDNNPCTDDGCEPSIGCRFDNNENACDDGNACTEPDRCGGGICVGGEVVICDDKTFCNGIETCDSQLGCVLGEEPSCNDTNACTLDSCDSEIDGCVHLADPAAVEGPLGAMSCQDLKDNDCDNLKDSADPDCRFGITGVVPSDGPGTGGTAVTISGDEFSQVESVVIGSVDVDFIVVSDTEIRVTAPAHAPGIVDVAVVGSRCTYTASRAFTFTARNEDSAIHAELVAPADTVTIVEGATAGPCEATVASVGITDIATPNPGVVRAQFGWGPRGSSPWENTDWYWIAATYTGANGVAFEYEGNLTVVDGGYFDIAVRFSFDNGITWVYGDLDSSDNGWSADMAPDLTVWGVADLGDIVINELMWMGSVTDDWDEWIELRNMTAAPYDLSGFVIMGAGYPTGSNFVLSSTLHVANNLILEPYDYFLVSQYSQAKSAIDVAVDVYSQADESTSKGMKLSNTGPRTYKLERPDGAEVDVINFSGYVGFESADASGLANRSMERDAELGDGKVDSSWHTAYVTDGWDGDPLQRDHVGTPGRPNSDVGICVTDEECSAEYPDVELTRCQKWSCVEGVNRCQILDVPNGGECDDGLFCTVMDQCLEGVCGNGQPRNCSDEGASTISPCTLDSCDEVLDQCVHVIDPSALEGPGDDATCNDNFDNDCDGKTDDNDIQCSMTVTSASPTTIPTSGYWSVIVGGTGFQYSGSGVPTNLAKGVLFGSTPAGVFVVYNDTQIEVTTPVISQAGDVILGVTDNKVTATFATPIRVIGLADDVASNTQFPVSDLQVSVGVPTPLIFGRVYSEGVTGGVSPVDPGELIAEIGYGPKSALDSKPFEDQGWTWLAATYNDLCPDCGDSYEYMKSLSIAVPGEYLIAFRFSIDGGYHYHYGDIAASPEYNAFNPNAALMVRVIQ